MRCAFLVLAAGLLLAAAPAQSQTFEAFGVRAGTTITGITTIDPNYDDRIGLVAAGVVQFAITPDLGLVGELEYGMRGFDFVYRRGTPQEQTARTLLHFVSVPLFVQINYGLGATTDLFARVGPRFDYVVGGDVESFTIEDGTELQDDIGAHVDVGFGGGISLGGGVNLRQLVGTGVQIEARYVFGLSDLAPTLQFQNVNLRALDITVGILF